MVTDLQIFFVSIYEVHPCMFAEENAKETWQWHELFKIKIYSTVKETFMRLIHIV